MRIRKAVLCCAMVGLAGFFSASSRADTILTFGQAVNGSTITGTKSGNDFEIKAAGIAVTISQIDPSSGLGTPISAFLDLDLDAIGAATSFGSLVAQEFSGTFSITSLAGGGGTNYLSGTLSGFVGGTIGSTSLAFSANSSISFTSSVITNLGSPRGFSLSFANVTPPVGQDGTTLQSFSSSVSGTASAFSAVPEPSAYISALIGMAGIVPVVLARRNRARA